MIGKCGRGSFFLNIIPDLFENHRENRRFGRYLLFGKIYKHYCNNCQTIKDCRKTEFDTEKFTL